MVQPCLDTKLTISRAFFPRESGHGDGVYPRWRRPPQRRGLQLSRRQARYVAPHQPSHDIAALTLPTLLFPCPPTDTEVSVIERTFKELTERQDIGILLINQHVANEIRSTLRDYSKLVPTVLEIPSKDYPYDPEKDYIMQRVNMLLGGGGDEK